MINTPYTSHDDTPAVHGEAVAPIRGWLNRRLSDGRKFLLALELFDAPVAPSVLRLLRLLLRDRYSPSEIFMLGLLDPRKGPRELARYFSNEKLLHLQLQLNPLGSRHLTHNKIAFYRHCLDGGLPTPQIHAVFSRAPVPHATSVPWLSTDEDWVRFLVHLPVESLVIKPTTGAHGQGVRMLDVSSEGHLIASGKRYDERHALTPMRLSGHDSWIVQERLIGHRELKRVANTDCVQTARIVTYVDSGRKTAIIGSRIRLIGGQSFIDNFNFGLSGNLMGSVDPRSGRIRNVVTMRSDLLGLVRVTRHPATGRELVGFEVPLWRDVIDLVERASRHFFPLRTVGWDVAITDGGVFLIEGNENWDSGFYDLDFTNEYELLYQCALSDTHGL